MGAALVLALGGGMAACQSHDGASGTGASSGSSSASSSSGSGSGSGGAGGSSSLGMFTPMGCGFSIAQRPEYMSWSTSQPTVGATPNIRRVRLGLGGNVQGTTGRADPSTEFGVAWQTDEGTLVSEVEWGTTADPTSWAPANRVSGITWDTPSGVINANGPERMHEAYVCGLTPATTYYYRVGGGPKGSEAWSPVFTFTTTPAAGPATVTIAITGDSRGEEQNAWQILQRRLHTLAPTMALFSGDAIDLATDQGEWEEWLDRAELDSDGKTYLTLPELLSVQAHGNHENHSALFFGNLVLPQDNVKYPAYGELFFSFDVGPVHVVVVDNMYISDGGDPNYQPALTAWLNADLTAANANRGKVPWIVTVNHYSSYSSSTHGKDPDVLQARAYFAPIFQQYHVDMAFSGHDHNYERSHPLSVGSDVNNPTVTTDAMGTTYVVCAGSGADAYGNGTSPFTAFSANFKTGPIGVYGILTATPSSLELDAHDLMTDASDPIIDTYTISK